MSCQLQIINRQRLLKMGLASAMVIIGVVLKNTAEQAKNLSQGLRTAMSMAGMAFFIGGWAFVAYNLYQTIPEKAKFYIPAIISIIVAVMVMKMTNLPKMPFGFLFMAGWGLLGWSISDHLDGTNRWLGPVASLLVIASMIFVLPWQRTNCVVDGLGLPMFTSAWALISVIHAYPTIEGVKASGPECLQELASKIPELSPYVTELDCVIKSGCFDEISSMKPEESPKYISKLIDSVACAGQHCTIFQKISVEIECLIKNCISDILKNPPKTPGKWGAALLTAYTKCEKTCHLPPLF